MTDSIADCVALGHDYRFAYAFVDPSQTQVGQPQAAALYYCIRCLREEIRPMHGALVWPGVQVQLTQVGPTPGLPHF